MPLANEMDRISSPKIVILVKRATLEFERMSAPIFQERGLTSAQYRVLKYLYLMEGQEPVRAVDIERFYNLTHPTTITLVDALEKKGYATRRPNPDDARSRIIELTDKAREERSDLFELGDLAEEKFTETLDGEEREQLISLLKKLLSLS